MKKLLAALLLAVLGSAVQAQTISTVSTVTAVESAHVLKPTGGNLYGFQVNTGATAPWVMLFNAAGVPAAAGAAVNPVKWYQVAINNTLGVQFSPPLAFASGIVIVCSSTGPFTFTATSTCTFSAEVQ